VLLMVQEAMFWLVLVALPVKVAVVFVSLVVLEVQVAVLFACLPEMVGPLLVDLSHCAAVVPVRPAAVAPC
jgi:hypothetical protein